MSEAIFFLLIGLGVGSIYAVLGAGTVVVYKGSGVINLAYGAMAMYGVLTFDAAWNRGQLFLPWVDFLPTHTLNVPVRITLSESGSWPLAPSLIVAIVMAVFLALAAHFLIFRPLRNAAPLGKVVASLGLMLYLQDVALLNFGNTFPIAKSIVPDGTIENFLGLGRPFPVNTLIAAGMTIVFGIALWALYRFTTFGLATRAAEGNEKGAILLGYSPHRLAAINWVIASVMATVAAIVAGPLQGALTPVGLTAFIVPALAAALIGRMQSVSIAVAGGLGLGMFQKLLEVKAPTWLADAPLSYVQNGITQAIPLLVIVLVLVFRGRSLPIRGTVVERRLPRAPQPVRIAPHSVAWIVVVATAAFFFENSGSRTVFANAIQTGLVFAIIGLSVVVLTGYVGQISLAQMSFSGVAAFFMARMMADGTPQGTNLIAVSGPGMHWLPAAILGILAAVVVGLILALPALRIRGVQLAVVTIAAAVAIQALYLENEELTQLRSGVPATVTEPMLFGLNISARSARVQNERPAFAIFAGIVLALVAVAIANIRRSGSGRRFLAVRSNERAAAAAGVDVAGTKLLAFGISAAIAGLGGVMLAFKQVDVSPANFPFGASVFLLALVYMGGVTSINGGMFSGLLTGGGVVIVSASYFLSDANIEQYLTTLGAIGMIVTAIVHQSGAVPFFQGLMRQAGEGLVTAVPGAVSLRAEASGPRRHLLGLIGTAVFVGLAVFAYRADAIASGILRGLAVIGLALVASMATSAAFGGFRPTVGEAARVWSRWAVIAGPVALVGYIAGWLIWPLRSDQYSAFWIPLLGAVLALLVATVLSAVRRVRRPSIPSPVPAAEPIAMEV